MDMPGLLKEKEWIMQEKIADPTVEAQRRLVAMYDAKMAHWPVPYESFTVSTRFGSTHVTASGPQDAPPLVLVHAMGVTSTMWQPNVGALSREYRVYALDTIGDQGKSKLDSTEHYPKNGQGYSLWLVDVFNELGIEQADVIGASMGGWITMNHAIYAPERVRRIALLGPMGLPSWLTTLKTISHLWSVLLFPTQANIHKMINWALGDNPAAREAYMDFMKIGVSGAAGMKLSPPLNLPDGKLRQIQVPTMLMLGDKDGPIGSAKEVSERARRLIPNVQVEILPGVGHMMNTECPEFVNTRVLDFLKGTELL